MFSNGQLLFAVFFVIAFTIAIIYTYRKDFKGHQVHYKGSFKILLTFIAAIVVLFFIKYFTQAN
jgi:heme/copper-type cytochrome/quinol oxidase subunit 2